MGLEQKIENDLKTAMKNKESGKVSALRMLKAAIENLSIEKKRAELTDEDIIKVIRSHIRKLKESIEQFEKGNRKDLEEKERSELKIAEAYLPQQLSEQDIEKLVKEVIFETSATSKRDMGKVMKAVMDKVKGRSDGQTVSRIVANSLP